MKNKRFFSLRVKQLGALVLGVSVGLIMFYAVQQAGDFFINTYYLSDSAMAERQQEAEASFTRYITENNVAVTDISAISAWVNRQKNVYLTIYEDSEIIYESGFWNEAAAEKNIDTPVLGNGEENTEYIYADILEFSEFYDLLPAVSFRDGEHKVFIMEFSEENLYRSVEYVSWGGFFVFLFVIQLVFNNRIIAHIKNLSKEVAIIGQGNLEHPITITGKDEISLLASNADNMRNAIIATVKDEKAAWEANSELITSISHDIRTPLTSLLGFLEVLDGGEWESKAEAQKFLTRSKNKALQLKELSDKLFQYFLVFGTKSVQHRMETYEADILLEQLLLEYIMELKNAGFTVYSDLQGAQGMIRADMLLLKRLFDNLFCNIQKHAAPEAGVTVKTESKGEELLITLSNETRKDSALVESTNIGLKTCAKIVELMKGELLIVKDNMHFEVRIVFPIEKTAKDVPV